MKRPTAGCARGFGGFFKEERSMKMVSDTLLKSAQARSHALPHQPLFLFSLKAFLFEILFLFEKIHRLSLSIPHPFFCAKSPRPQTRPVRQEAPPRGSIFRSRTVHPSLGGRFTHGLAALCVPLSVSFCSFILGWKRCTTGHRTGISSFRGTLF